MPWTAQKKVFTVETSSSGSVEKGETLQGCTYLYELSGNFNVLLTYVLQFTYVLCSHLGKYIPEGPRYIYV